MKELLIIMALMGASEEEAKQKVVHSQIPSTITSEHVDVDTTFIHTRPMQCWTTNVYHSNGSVTPKVQCQ
jgi:hypothetical protein